MLVMTAVVPLSDLPVHCLQQQIIGDWVLRVGDRHAAPQLCGHHTPGAVEDVVAADHASLRGERLKVRLEAPDLATAISETGEEGEVGWWTMIYDQGFEVRLSGRTYFAFSSVVRDAASSAVAPAIGQPEATARFTSLCSHTAVGWYHEVANETHGDAWGCYAALRVGGSGRNESAAAAALRHRKQVDGAKRAPPPMRAAHDERPDQLKYAGLPSAWDWRDVNGVNYVPPARTQGACGACYVIAAVGMLESRLAIASGGRERPTLSVQEVLSCSPYSQGCLGGFPYLVVSPPPPRAKS